jgi:hypothetical protein
VNRYGNRITIRNMTFNRAMNSSKVYHMLALDMRGAFLSISHPKGFYSKIVEVICKSYDDAVVKIVTPKVSQIQSKKNMS